jgi:RimJ/RimL family protein N-acetyltransferase
MADRSMPLEVETERLILRQWRDSDRESFAAMNADPEVMRYFTAPRSRAESDALLDWMRAKWRRDGFGFWVVELKGAGDNPRGLIGFCGLNQADFPKHLLPFVEVGWRLMCWAWGNGYATEAARASLALGFETLGLAEVVAPAIAGNARSRAVMERLGMRHDPADDFDDPNEAVGSLIRPLVVYRLSCEDWKP